MAGFITHAYFSLDLYDKLSIRSKELLIDKKEYLKTFSLGNKILLYCNDKKMKKFNNYFTSNKVNDFFTTLTNYIKYNNYQYNPQIIAYLYGMISNYILSTTVNPFIIYRTNNNKEELESYLDNYMISIRSNMNPYSFKCFKACFNINYLNKDLIEVMDFTYKEVFGIENFHKYYLNSIVNARNFYKKYRYDPKGTKKRLYLIHDKFFKNKPKKEYLSYHVKKRKDDLNLEKNTWYNPTSNKIKSNESYIELYTKALDKTDKIIHEINNFFYYDKNINYNKLIGNNDYDIARDCSKDYELKYFLF